MADTDIKINQFLTAEGAQDWRITSEGALAFYRTDSLAKSAELVSRLAAIPGLGDHQFGIDIREQGVTVRVVTLRDDYMGMTQRDLELARAISAVAHEMDLESDTTAIQSFLVVPGAP